MDSRKVQRIGLKTLAVTLPKHWVKSVGLKPGDIIVFTIQADNSLLLRPSNMLQKKTELSEVIYSDLCNEPNLLERLIIGSYILGVDTIKIMSSGRIRASCIETVRKITHKLMGIGIIQESSNEIVLQCSIDPTRFPIDVLVRRLYIIVSTMHRDVMSSLKELDIDLAKEVVTREYEANMVYWLILRLLKSVQDKRDLMFDIGITSVFQILSLWSITQYLERIGDWVKNIAELIIMINQEKLSLEKADIENILKMGEKAYEICYLAMQSLYRRDIKLANSIIDEYKEYFEEGKTDFLRKRSSCIMEKLEFAMRRIAELGAEIAEMIIDSCIETPNEICEITKEEVNFKNVI